MQPDVYLIDCVGGSHAVHRSLLRVKFPVLRDLADFDAVILDEVTPQEVELMVIAKFLPQKKIKQLLLTFCTNFMQQS